MNLISALEEIKHDIIEAQMCCADNDRITYIEAALENALLHVEILIDDINEKKKNEAA